MSDRLEQFVQENRAAFDELQPDPRILQRIEARIQPASVKKISLAIRMVRYAAAAVVISLAGYGALQLLQDKPVAVPEAVVGAPVNTPVKTSPAESKVIDAEIPAAPTIRLASNTGVNKKQLLFAKLNNMESASERYAAASAVAEFKKTDRDIVAALVKTMHNDPNSNVRLAALDALSQFSREPFVKQQLLKSLSTQKDPVVQVALIELLTRMRARNIVTELQKLTEDEQTSKPVKDQAYNGLMKLSS
jgi:HEAT repeat protein